MSQILGNLFLDGETLTDLTGNHTVTNDGSPPTVSTAQKKFGNSSLLFSSAQKAIIPDHDDFHLGTGNFTFDFWFYCDDLTGMYYPIYEQRAAGPTDIVIWLNGDLSPYGARRVTFYTRNPNVNISSDAIITPSTWHHVAVVRYGTGLNELLIFVDGQSINLNISTAMDANENFGNLAANPTIGFSIGAGGGVQSRYIDNFRFAKGQALWTSNFSLNEVALFYTASVNPNRPDLITQLYNLSSVKGNIRGKGQNFVRPTLKQYFTTVDFTEVIKAPQGGGTTFLGYGTSDLCTGGTATDEGRYATTGGGPAGAFDDNTAVSVTNSWYFTEWPAEPTWIQYELPEAKVVGKIRQNTWGGGSGHEYVTSMTIYGSNDGTNFTELTTWVPTAINWSEHTFDNKTAYTHYRMLCTFSVGNMGGGAHVSEIELYEALYGLKYTSDLCTGGTSYASTLYTGLQASYAVDNNDTNIFMTNATEPPGWWYYDFGLGNEKQVEKYTLTAPWGGNELYGPKDWTFEGSNDASNWTVLDTQTGVTWTESQKREYELINTNSYRYYRMNMTASGDNGYVGFAEIEMMEVDPYTPDRCVDGTATADIWWSSWGPAAAFDDNAGTGWHTSPLATGKLQYQFTSAKQIEKYTIRSRYLDNRECPRIWTFEGSNDAIDWTVLDTQTDNSALDGAYVAEYLISNTNSYTYYRLNITASQGGSAISIMEVEMMEKYR